MAALRKGDKRAYAWCVLAFALCQGACDDRLNAGYNLPAAITGDAAPTDATPSSPFSFNGKPVALQLNGDAVSLDPALGIELTRSLENQEGSAYLPMMMPLTAGKVITVFAAFVIEPSELAADGVAFVWHNDPRGIYALGGTGGGISIGNLTPSFAVVFDTHNGSGFELAPNVCMGHGNNFATAAVATRTVPFDLPTGEPVFVWIDYGAQRLAVFVSHVASKPTAPWIEAPVDLVKEVGSTAAFGVAAATGAKHSRHRLLSLQVSWAP
ncbi:MAG: L-type lectin-domain containing protein [Deltaproteobacteria bacterium]|nr:L-type lectin-domain containing protein [Deltaproteobacteria bacterium]